MEEKKIFGYAVYWWWNKLILSIGWRVILTRWIPGMTWRATRRWLTTDCSLRSRTPLVHLALMDWTDCSASWLSGNFRYLPQYLPQHPPTPPQKRCHSGQQRSIPEIMSMLVVSLVRLAWLPDCSNVCVCLIRTSWQYFRRPSWRTKLWWRSSEHCKVPSAQSKALWVGIHLENL